MKEYRFNHRIAFGCWINDVRDMPSLNKIWPNIKIDRYTIKSMTNLIDLISTAGYNSLDLFGLLVGENWPVNIEETLNRGREDKINFIIDYAHSKNLKIIFGLSIFGWGFKEIINYDPETKSNGCSVMCGSKNKSFVWQEKIIDFITAKFNIE